MLSWGSPGNSAVKLPVVSLYCFHWAVCPENGRARRRASSEHESALRIGVTPKKRIVGNPERFSHDWTAQTTGNPLRCHHTIQPPDQVRRHLIPIGLIQQLMP